MHDINESFSNNSETQQFSESFARDGLDSGTQVVGCPEVEEMGQVATPRQFDAWRNHDMIDCDLGTPVPASQTSLPAAPIQGVGDNDNIG